MRWEGLKPDDVVVIPAHNEEASIGLVVRYLMERGLSGDQLFVVDSGCTDRTVQTARDATSEGVLRVVNPYAEMGQRWARLAGDYGLEDANFAGKGAAMYAAVFALTHADHPPTSRVFFVDGDITNPAEVDPIGCLLRAWRRKPSARIAKLASAKRENEGILAFINTLPEPYNQMSKLAWPLCGQQSLRLCDLQRIPFPADFSVEVAFLAALVELYGDDCFTQEPIAAPLVEEVHPDDLQRYTRMFTKIMLFLREVVTRGGLTTGAMPIATWNRAPWRTVPDVGVPTVVPDGGIRETLIVDRLLPPINSLASYFLAL